MTLKRPFDLPQRADLGLDAPISPAPPGGLSDASLTENGGHVGAASDGPLFEDDDVRIAGFLSHDRDYMQNCTLHASRNAQPKTQPIVLSARMADEADEAREFIRRALKATGWSPYKLAKAAGIAPSTITRPLNDPEFKFVPKQGTLNKIAEAVGLVAPTVTEPSLSVEPVSQWVPIVGEVRAGTWTEIQEMPGGEDQVAVHLPEYQRASLFALRVVGRSMDLKYPDGTVVIAAPAAEAGVRLGDAVVVRRVRGGLAETTLKEVTQNGQGEYELTPRSSDASHKSLPFPSASEAIDGQDGFEIIGVVLYSIDPNRRGQGPLVSYF